MSETCTAGEFERYVGGVMRRTACLAGGLALAALAFGQAGAPAAWGLLLGAGFSLMRFWRRAQNLRRFADAPDDQGGAILLRGRMEAFLLAAFALALAFALPGVNWIAAAGGLFLTNVVVIATAGRAAAKHCS